MDITEVSIIHHVGIVLLVIWLLSSLNYCHSLVYFFCFIYLYMVHENFSTRFRRKVRFEERRQANQKRVLSDSESVRWLNHLVEKIWPICMENIVSQKILLPIMPWFLQKYKPWTVKEAVVQNLYMGRSPPMVTEMRVCRQSTGDDHLVLELGLNFRTADDMSAILAAKLTKRLGFGMSAKMHLTGMHVEGKVLVGIKFLPKWPFLGRLRVCFVEPPYFQMTVKPIFSHGLDVTEVHVIAGWLDKLLTVAFEETLVEPNMLVVDVEKFVSPEADLGQLLASSPTFQIGLTSRIFHWHLGNTVSSRSIIIVSSFAVMGYREKIVDIREEILRKRRAGKLPGDTASVLKSWWQLHAKWPYPTKTRQDWYKKLACG